MSPTMLVQFSFLILSLLKDSIIRRVAVVVVVCLSLFVFFWVDTVIINGASRGLQALNGCRAVALLLVDNRRLAFSFLVALLNVTTTLFSF